ncbi:MAG: MBL fold metallo-hydrolase [Deltaproteobacteria bacterium]|nr:MBL fold metallo-hydrolase [Deltaproteobacteria bacterium]
MIRETFPVGLLGCNCTILGDPVTHRAIVVDPGGDENVIRAALDRHGLTVTAVLHTHAHIDHVGATGPLCQATGAPAFLHRDDAALYDHVDAQAMMLGMPGVVRHDMRDLVEDAAHAAGAVEIGVLHTPGHTMGSCCFVVGGERILLSGDTLFRRGVGRTDLGGDWDALVRSIRERVLTLPDDTLVIPGHGPATTVGEERRHNPFLR